MTKKDMKIVFKPISSGLFSIIKNGLDTGYKLDGFRAHGKTGVVAKFWLVTPDGRKLWTGYCYFKDARNGLKSVFEENKEVDYASELEEWGGPPYPGWLGKAVAIVT